MIDNCTLQKYYLYCFFESVQNYESKFDMLVVLSVFQAEKQLELQLFKLYHNEAEIDELADELQKKTNMLEKENRRRERIEEEIKEKKKEQGKVARELTKVEQSIKESVSIKQIQSLSLYVHLVSHLVQGMFQMHLSQQQFFDQTGFDLEAGSK